MKKLFLLLLLCPVLLQAQVWTVSSGTGLVIGARGQRVLTVLTTPDAASQTLTATGQPLDTQTVTIGATVYTAETGALDADYKFLVGADEAATMVALCSCINGDDDGVVCDAGTAAHPTVTCTGVVQGASVTLIVSAITPGSNANAIVTTETLDNASWAGTTLDDVTDPVATVSPVDSGSATEHSYFSTLITGTTPSSAVINVEWPFYRVSLASGDGTVSILP